MPDVTVPPSRPRGSSLWPGLLPPVGLGMIAWLLGRQFPLLGAPVIGILLGLLVGQFIGLRPEWKQGVTFCSKKVLQASVVLLGAGMSLHQVVAIGGAGLPVMLGTIVVAVAAGIPISRALKVERETRILITYGTSICGASAIATMSQVIGAQASAVAVSVSVIVLYNVLAALTFPFLGQLMGLDHSSFGLWAGTAVNDTSSVVAASTAFDAQLLAAGIVATGMTAASYAVVVKLTRTLMIVPLAIFQQWFGNRGREAAERNSTPWYRMVPAFLVLFLVAAGLRSLGAIPDAAGPAIGLLASVGITVAMTAVGMTSSLTAIKAAGWRPLALGAILWALVAVSSLGLQLLTGQLHTLS